MLACFMLVSCSAHNPDLVPIDGGKSGYKKQVGKHDNIVCEEIREVSPTGYSWRSFCTEKGSEHKIEKYEDGSCKGFRKKDAEGNVTSSMVTCTPSKP